MRQGTSRKMPRKSTGLTDRLTLPMRPELLREIDQVRGDVPRVAWIRRACVGCHASPAEAAEAEARRKAVMIHPFVASRFRARTTTRHTRRAYRRGYY